MPYALYKKKTGEIVSVLPYQKPNNAPQSARLAEEGLEFVEVPAGVSPHNSIIDADTHTAIPTGPKMNYYFRYRYDPETGMIMETGSGNLEPTHPLLSAPHTIVLQSHNPQLQPAHILTLKEDKTPLVDGDGNYFVKPPTPPVNPPDKLTLVLAGMVKAGHVPASAISAPLLESMNASLALVDHPPIA